MDQCSEIHCILSICCQYTDASYKWKYQEEQFLFWLGWVYCSDLNTNLCSKNKRKNQNMQSLGSVSQVLFCKLNYDQSLTPLLEIHLVKILYSIHQEAAHSHGILNHLSKCDLRNFQMQYEKKIAAMCIKILLVKPNHIPMQLLH